MKNLLYKINNKYHRAYQLHKIKKILTSLIYKEYKCNSYNFRYLTSRTRITISIAINNSQIIDFNLIPSITIPSMISQIRIFKISFSLKVSINLTTSIRIKTTSIRSKIRCSQIELDNTKCRKMLRA